MPGSSEATVNTEQRDSRDNLGPPQVGKEGLFASDTGILDRVLVLVEYLRANCPWDRKQTSRSLVPHLLEETHETVDAIRADDAESLRGELGDLLFNLAFQVVIGEEADRFTREEVVRELEEKMVRRHPHVFGLGEHESWETIKVTERDRGTLDGLPEGLDPLLRAHRIQERVASVGFDWDNPQEALEKVREELSEVEVAIEGGIPEALDEEIGDLLFSVVNLARLLDQHAVASLELANKKFQQRFGALQALAMDRGLEMPGATLEELDQLWEEVKQRR
jgi:MazG family protein